MPRTVLTLLLAVSLIGCTSMQVSQGNKLPSALENLRPGDTVTVTTYSGAVIKLQVTTIDGRTLIGQSDEKSVSIPVIQIKSVAKSKISPGKTIGLTAGIVYAAITVLVVLGFYGLSQATK